MKPRAFRPLAMLCAVLAGCIDNTSDTPNGSPKQLIPASQDGPRGIVVVGSDHYSTSISVLATAPLRLASEGVLDSGSSPPGLSTALSGDVVLPGAINEKNWLVLLDRYPNAVLTFLHPDTFTVIGQMPVATGFSANPHDFLWVGANKAYVTRYETNATPNAVAHDGGDDILIVDPMNTSIVGRIALQDVAERNTDEVLQARPDRMVATEELVWVTLNHLSRNFEEAGEGRVVGIDPNTDQIAQRVSLPTLQNCGAMDYAAGLRTLFVSCTGLFAAGREAQLNASGIARIDLGSATPVVTVLRHGTDGIARPYGFEIDLVEERWLLAVRFGDIETEERDRLVAIELTTGTETIIHEATTAHGLGGILVDDRSSFVFVGDANPTTPRVHVFEVNDGRFVHREEVNAHPQTGLPPRSIRFY